MGPNDVSNCHRTKWNASKRRSEQSFATNRYHADTWKSSAADCGMHASASRRAKGSWDPLMQRSKETNVGYP